MRYAGCGVTKAIKNSVKNISIVLEELSNITKLEKKNYFKHSKAIDIEKSLKSRLDNQAANLR